MRRRLSGCVSAAALVSIGAATFRPMQVTAPSAVAASATPHADKLLIIAVPDLRWSDVNDAMPALRAQAGRSAVAELSVKSAASATRCANGLLTFSAAARTASSVDGCFVD